jgi:hypothetical protein
MPTSVVSDGSDSSAPGWYLDPASHDQLRFWDGQRWTHDIREAPAETISVDPEGSRSNEAELESADAGRNYATFVLGVLIVLFALGGFYEVLAGNSSGNSNPNRFAADAGTAPSPSTTLSNTLPARPGCEISAHRYDATHTINWLATKGIPVSLTVAPTTTRGGSLAAPPGSPCSRVTFADNRDLVPNQLWAYESPSEAAAAATSDHTPGTVIFTSAYYVVSLDAHLASFQAQYADRLGFLVAHQP